MSMSERIIRNALEHYQNWAEQFRYGGMARDERGARRAGGSEATRADGR